VSHPTQSTSVYRFGAFQLDVRRQELLKHGIRIRLQRKPFQVLTELVQRPGDVVTREELRRQLWPDGTFVDFDEGVNTAVKRLRTSLGDSPSNPIYLETVTGYGYRFIAPVSCAEPESEASPKRETPAGMHPNLPAELESPSSHRRRFWLWFSMAVLAVSAVTVSIYRLGSRRATPTPIQSIAVLPLENLSGDRSQDYFAEGITDEIITHLAKLGGPKVISRASAMHYKGTQKQVPEIARELNVGALVEGSVQRSGDRVRVRVQLIQADTDRHLWAEEYDRQLSDMLGLEADLARDIAQQIQIQLDEKQQRNLERNPTLNPRAFEDYLQGRHYWALRTQESLTKAVEYFNRAIQEDPNQARIYAGLAQCYIVLPFFGVASETEAYPKAREAALRALALDDSLAEAHLSVAEVRLYLDWDFAGAEREFKRTLDLNPNYSTGHQWYGEFLSIMGRHPEAIREQEAALALDPLSPIIHHQAAGTLRDAGKYDEALEQYTEALKLNPNFLSAYEAVSWSFRRQGKFVESIEALRRAAPLWGFRAAAMSREFDKLKSAYTADGKAGYLRQSLEVHKHYARSSYYLARDYAELGDREAAVAELERSYRNHDIEVLWLLADPEVESIHSDPRVQRLIRAIGFPQ
jgi:TolB-like protein/DNA-binding winged helix-turn-helix (wHTH) protein/Tfp pilus assembly protein PilF